MFDPQTMSTGERIITWQRALHYGIGLGGGYKFLVFVSGVIIPVFAVTGFLMWWLQAPQPPRRRDAPRPPIQAAAARAASHCWGGRPVRICAGFSTA